MNYPIIVLLEDHTDQKVLKSYPAIFKALKQLGYDSWTVEQDAAQSVETTIEAFETSVQNAQYLLEVLTELRCTQQLLGLKAKPTTEQLSKLHYTDLHTILTKCLKTDFEQTIFLIKQFIAITANKQIADNYKQFQKFMHIRGMDMSFEDADEHELIGRNPTMVSNIFKYQQEGATQVVNVGALHFTGFVSEMHAKGMLGDVVFIHLHSDASYMTTPSFTSYSPKIDTDRKRPNFGQNIIPEINPEIFKIFSPQHKIETSAIEAAAQKEQLPITVYSFKVDDPNDLYFLSAIEQIVKTHSKKGAGMCKPSSIFGASKLPALNDGMTVPKLNQADARNPRSFSAHKLWQLPGNKTTKANSGTLGNSEANYLNPMLAMIFFALALIASRKIPSQKPRCKIA